jgi:tRNA dimethylallyltransferase
LESEPVSAESQEKLLVVVGPTATAKSALAASLAARMNGEVVSADSVQVYRHFDIGSGKPSAEERALAPHHLIDIADPLDSIEASVWADRAQATVSEIRSRGKTPIVCGGTFLWVRALLFGLAEAPPGDPEIRERHKEQAQEEGREKLHQALAQVDPTSAKRLHPNDLVRVSRALEVHELTGRTLSEIQAEHGFREPRYRAHLLGVEWERPAYEERLAARVRQMVAAGWKEEVSGLLSAGYGGARAMDAVGYRQVREAVESSTSQSDEDLVQEITRVTRIFARRQRTWLRDEPVDYVPSALLNDEKLLPELVERLVPLA